MLEIRPVPKFSVRPQSAHELVALAFMTASCAGSQVSFLQGLPDIW